MTEGLGDAKVFWGWGPEVYARRLRSAEAGTIYGVIPRRPPRSTPPSGIPLDDPFLQHQGRGRARCTPP